MWSGKLRLFDSNGNQYEEYCKGSSMGHAAHLALRGVKHNYVRVETMDGTKLAGSPRPNGFSLRDVASTIPTGFQKASRDRAVVGEEISGKLKEELRKLDGMPSAAQASPPPSAPIKMAQHEMLMAIASKLPDPFRVEDVSDRLAVAGFAELAKNLKAIRSIISTAIYIRGDIERVPDRKGVYRFKTKAPTIHKQTVSITVESKKEKPIPTPPAVNPAVAPPSLDSLSMAAAVSLCMRPEDREVLQDAVSKQRASLEASLKVAEILDRMLRLEATREKFAEVLRTLKHASET